MGYKIYIVKCESDGSTLGVATSEEDAREIVQHFNENTEMMFSFEESEIIVLDKLEKRKALSAQERIEGTDNYTS